jgi:hypothetical protein
LEDNASPRRPSPEAFRLPSPVQAMADFFVNRSPSPIRIAAISRSPSPVASPVPTPNTGSTPLSESSETVYPPSSISPEGDAYAQYCANQRPRIIHKAILLIFTFFYAFFLVCTKPLYSILFNGVVYPIFYVWHCILQNEFGLWIERVPFTVWRPMRRIRNQMNYCCTWLTNCLVLYAIIYYYGVSNIIQFIITVKNRTDETDTFLTWITDTTIYQITATSINRLYEFVKTSSNLLYKLAAISINWIYQHMSSISDSYEYITAIKNATYRQAIIMKDEFSIYIPVLRDQTMSLYQDIMKRILKLFFCSESISGSRSADIDGTLQDILAATKEQTELIYELKEFIQQTTIYLLEKVLEQQ